MSVVDAPELGAAGRMAALISFPHRGIKRSNSPYGRVETFTGEEAPMVFRHTRLVLSLLAALVVAVPLAHGQGVQTSSISGTVRDTGDLVLPGVTVTVTSPALQGVRTTTTDANGNYVLRGLPPGSYAVEFELSGFATARQSAVLELGRTSEVNAAMQVAGVTEAITVVAANPAEVTSTQGGANYKYEEVDALAMPRTIAGIAELAPGLTDNTFNAGQLSISGAFGYDNVFLLDGVDIQDNLFGDTNDLFIEDAIEETQVLTSGISAEYGRFTGGVVNAISKAGGDIFSGSFRATFVNPEWTDETPFEEENGTERPSDLSKWFEGTFGGPIVRSRLWFFGAGRYQKLSESVPLDQTAIQVDEITDEKRGEIKLTGTLLTNHTLQGTYVRNELETTDRTFPFDMDPRSSVTTTVPNDLFVATYRGVLGPKVFVEGQYSAKEYRFEGAGGTLTDLVESPFISLTPFGLYNAPYFDATDPEDRDNWQVTGNLSYYLTTARTGSHDIKGGLEVFESTNTGGNSQSATSYVFFADAGLGPDGRPIVLPNGRFVPQFRPFETFVNNWQATRGAQLDIRTTSFYVQDRWALNRHWSFDVGMRYERVRSEATGNILGIDTDTFVPRLAATWDPKGDGRWVVQATYAHYAGKYSEAQFSANTNVGNPDLVQLVYVGPAGEGFDFAPGLDLANYVPVDGSFNSANVSFEGGLSSPVNREFTLGLGHQFNDRAYAKAQWVRRRLTGIVDDFRDLTTGSASVVRDGVEYGPFTNSIYRNTDEATREYDALVFLGNYRLHPRWSVNGHWTVQLQNEGNFEGEATNQPVLPSAIGDFPELYTAARHFPFGNLPGFQRNKVRLWTIYNQGLGRFGDADLSLLYRYDSATTYSLVTSGDDALTPIQEQLGAAYASLPTNQAVYFGERGTEFFNGFSVFDFAVTYSIPVFKSARPWFKLEIRNLFNDKTLIGWNTDVFQDPASPTDSLGLHTGYVEGETFGEAEALTDYPVPRTFRMALGFRF